MYCADAIFPYTYNSPDYSNLTFVLMLWHQNVDCSPVILNLAVKQNLLYIILYCLSKFLEMETAADCILSFQKEVIWSARPSWWMGTTQAKQDRPGGSFVNMIWCWHRSLLQRLFDFFCKKFKVIFVSLSSVKWLKCQPKKSWVTGFINR